MNDRSDISLEQALDNLIETAQTLPGTYSAEVGLWYYAGVIDAKRWVCEVEADISGNHFSVWGSTPQQAIELAIAEAWRRVPSGADSDVEVSDEWYWRDAWLLAAVFLAGNGSGADLPDVLGATRRSSTPALFIDCETFGWATSELIEAKLLSVEGQVFLPSERAAELWSLATSEHPVMMGSGFSRSLLRVMQASEPVGRHIQSWSIAEADYLRAIHHYIGRVLGIPEQPY